ncbi:MAG: hypothetical protein OHK0035_28220 [Cyanobacteria bacterium J069]
MNGVGVSDGFAERFRLREMLREIAFGKSGLRIAIPANQDSKQESKQRCPMHARLQLPDSNY